MINFKVDIPDDSFLDRVRNRKAKLTKISENYFEKASIVCSFSIQHQTDGDDNFFVVTGDNIEDGEEFGTSSEALSWLITNHRSIMPHEYMDINLFMHFDDLPVSEADMLEVGDDHFVMRV